jgi:NLR family CARD domain-containing protein 3
LVRKRLKPASACFVAELLRPRCELRLLSLENNKIGDDGAKAVAALLAVSSMAELNLAVNLIGDEGAVALGAGLAASRTLKALSLYHNKVSDHGTSAIGNTLETSALETLDLSFNAVRSVDALAEALWGNSSLSDLDLSGNQIGDEGALKLSKAVEVNRTLKVCRLALNKLSTATTMALDKACAGRDSLVIHHS